MSKLQLVQGDSFVIIGNDGFTVFVKKINLFYGIIIREFNTADTQSCFFLFRDFTDVKSKENPFFGA